MIRAFNCLIMSLIIILIFKKIISFQNGISQDYNVFIEIIAHLCGNR